MKITQEINNKKATLKLEGNFTYTQRKAFQEALKVVCSDPIEEIVIDLSQVAFLGNCKSTNARFRWPILSRRFARSLNWRICTRRSR